MCENPCKIFGIKNKGFIKESFDADLTIVDMDKEVTIKNEMIAVSYTHLTLPTRTVV